MITIDLPWKEAESGFVRGFGFSLGSHDAGFSSGPKETSTPVLRNGESGLLVRSRTTREVSEHTIINESARPSSVIDTIEPLCVTFDCPLSDWRINWAAGGTTEHHYPPFAYRTHEATRIRRPFEIASHDLGRSSNTHLPLLIAVGGEGGDGESPRTGEGFVCGLEWSGAWYIRLEEGDDPKTSRLRAGVRIDGIRLAPREELRLPRAHFVRFRGGIDDGRNVCRRYLYENVCARRRGGLMLPPVSYDHSFGIGNDLSDDLLRAQANRARELGVEVFAVDASWFEGDFPLGVGNWDRVDRAKFPRGLRPFSDYVRSLGMQFGLWFEPERAVEGTSAVEAHPEWYIPATVRFGRRDYHINLALREAQDYVIETVGGYIESLQLRWSRWDYNIDPRPAWDAVDPTGKIQFAYMEGLYRVLDTLMRLYPDWIVEGCSSGGRRIDMGTMRRAHTFWFSDQSTDPFLCRYMQARANCFLPGHLLNSSVAVPAGAGDDGFDDTTVLSRMLGKLAFDGDVASWSSSLTARMAGWTDVFRRVRPLLVQDFYQLFPIPHTCEDWDAVQFSDYNARRALCFAFAPTAGGECALVMKRLRHEAHYRINRLFHDREETVFERIAGRTLCSRGFAVRLAPGEGGLWLIELT